ncbi:MAG: NAD-dependent epimerase/dehydratase family protein [Myxococcota bacterium]|nr:NAD-dependent epimerase/dehydratase family protein [Myxococcota bacterium]
MKVFVTGALGFIGRALLERYRAAGAEVVGIDRQADAALGVVAGDVLEPDSFRERLRGCDLVFHTAAVVSNVAPEQAFWQVNVLGTRRLLEACAAEGVGRFVHLSSVGAYGFDFPDGVDETYPLRPNGNHYVDSKVASEQVVLQAHAAAEIECSIVRPADVYGPGSRPWTVLPVEMMRSGQFLLPESGRGIFSPVYVDNLVDGLEAVASNEAACGQVFILGDGVGVTTAEFFGHYARMLGAGPVRTLPTPLAKGIAGIAGAVLGALGRETEVSAETMRMLARRGGYSIEKARRVLGFEPKVDLAEGMQRTERWLADRGMLG